MKNFLNLKKNIDGFFKSSYHKNLGWLKKANITDFHDKIKKKTKFSIDKFGQKIKL